MKMAPRLLPLVGIAVVGVLGLKLTGGIDGLSSLIGARAQAEGMSLPAKGKRVAEASPTAEGAAPAAETPIQTPGVLPGLPAQAQANAPPAGPAVCAPSATELAKEAGLSPAELQVIQTLGARRGQLDAREQALDTQLQLIAAAEQKLNGRIEAMNNLKAEIQALAGTVDAQQQAEIDRLVVVYEKMSVKQAGPLMAALNENVRLQLAAKLKPSKLASILAQMPTAEGKALTESLAKRFSPAQTLQQALNDKSPAAPAPATDAKAAPVQAAATPPTAVPKAAAAPPKPRQAKAAPRRAKPAPVATAKADAAKAPVAKPPVEPATVAATGVTSKPPVQTAAAAAPPKPSKPSAGPPV